MILSLAASVVLVLSAAVISAGLIRALRPWLRRYALAQPNGRSSHREPTPQGAGLAVMLAVLGVVMAAPHLWPGLPMPPLPVPLLVALVLMAVVGGIDDIRPLPVVLRLLLQATAAMLLVLSLPEGTRICPQVPWIVESALLVLGGVWFVNLVNFMDGLDWISVAEVVPVTAGLGILGAVGALPAEVMLAALALLGAMLGFAVFNRPVARVFLGDVGSLPIGLLLAWMLIVLAGQGHWAAALLLPLYYLADATVTLLLRMLRGERFWQAHRTHFYQRATDGGYSVLEIDARIFVLNCALVGLALVTVVWPGLLISLPALALGAALVAAVLAAFARGRR